MDLSSDLISQFVKVTNDSKTPEPEVTVYGTIVNDGNRDYVRIDGSSELAPISATVEVSPGDRVIVTVKNHSATVTGNETDPAIGTKTADGLRSSITQTAEEIRMEVANEVAGLQSSITQNANNITALVQNQDEFSEFKQTVEGFSFMNKGGTVKIESGSIDLTGSISWSDLASDTQSEITDAQNTATSAYNMADYAYQTANSISIPSYIKSTYIDFSTVQSPKIIGGDFYAVDGDTSFMNMNANGLYLYHTDITTPKAMLTMDSTGSLIQFILGSGTELTTTASRFYIQKGTTKVGLYYVTSSGDTVGFTFSDDGSITVHGSMPATFA